METVAAASSPQVYRPRRPERTVLYRTLTHHFEQFLQVYAGRFRIFFRYDRKLLGELAGCAWRALKLYFTAYFDSANVSPGAVGFVQTAGELLNFHPHVHVLVTPVPSRVRC